MTRFFTLALLVTSAAAGAENPGAASLRVENERAPRGGRAVVRVGLTEPKPIIFGETRLQFDPAVLTSVAGAAALSESLQVMGAGTFDLAAGAVQARFTSTAPDFGLGALPILVVALDVNPNAPQSATSPLVVNPANTRLLDPASQPYIAEVKQGTFSVGGVSIDEVIPPSGTVAAGTVVTVRGKGFQPGAGLAIESAATGAVQYVSESEMRVAAQEAFSIEGRRIRVRNPDGSEDLFYAYTPAPTQPSGDALLARTIPFFSREKLTRAAVTFPSLLAPGAKALAIQNPDSDSAQAVIELFSASNERLGRATVQVSRRGVPVQRTLAELVPGLADTQVRTAVITSEVPIRVLGLQTDPAGGGVNPIPASAAVAPQIAGGGVVNAASYQPGVVPGGIVAIFGSGFATGEIRASTLPLPSTLGGVRVSVGGADAPLFYAGPTQINAQVPWSVGAGPVPVVVTTARGASAPVTVSSTSEAPGLLSQDGSGRGPGAIVDALTGVLVTPANPVPRKGFATIYGVGLGAVASPPAAGAATPADSFSPTLTVPTVTVGGVPAIVLFAGLSPGSVSLYQINVEIPESAPSGSAVEVRVEVNGVPGNPVTAAIR